ncbi:hypothetical protein [Absidia glauca]|uniref:Ndc10 domain-containing protein n=1 Tax=Absidia glauca TaxID=4829 RepID=A0A163JU34_ABSGL|nr:hypothetical protein [Absidia glauca]
MTIRGEKGPVVILQPSGFETPTRASILLSCTCRPPTSLCKKLFPAIGKWHDRLPAKELSPDDPIQPTVAENAFVQVIMMELHPCYPIWQHLIFSDPAYLSFKRNLLPN